MQFLDIQLHISNVENTHTHNFEFAPELCQNGAFPAPYFEFLGESFLTRREHSHRLKILRGALAPVCLAMMLLFTHAECVLGDYAFFRQVLVWDLSFVNIVTTCQCYSSGISSCDCLMKEVAIFPGRQGMWLCGITVGCQIYD